MKMKSNRDFKMNAYYSQWDDLDESLDEESEDISFYDNLNLSDEDVEIMAQDRGEFYDVERISYQ